MEFASAAGGISIHCIIRICSNGSNGICIDKSGIDLNCLSRIGMNKPETYVIYRPRCLVCLLTSASYARRVGFNSWWRGRREEYIFILFLSREVLALPLRRRGNSSMDFWVWLCVYAMRYDGMCVHVRVCIPRLVLFLFTFYEVINHLELFMYVSCMIIIMLSMSQLQDGWKYSWYTISVQILLHKKVFVK